MVPKSLFSLIFCHPYCSCPPPASLNSNHSSRLAILPTEYALSHLWSFGIPSARKLFLWAPPHCLICQNSSFQGLIQMLTLPSPYMCSNALSRIYYPSLYVSIAFYLYLYSSFEILWSLFCSLWLLCIYSIFIHSLKKYLSGAYYITNTGYVSVRKKKLL